MKKLAVSIGWAKLVKIGLNKPIKPSRPSNSRKSRFFFFPAGDETSFGCSIVLHIFSQPSEMGSAMI